MTGQAAPGWCWLTPMCYPMIAGVATSRHFHQCRRSGAVLQRAAGCGWRSGQAGCRCRPCFKPGGAFARSVAVEASTANASKLRSCGCCCQHSPSRAAACPTCTFCAAQCCGYALAAAAATQGPSCDIKQVQCPRSPLDIFGPASHRRQQPCLICTSRTTCTTAAHHLAPTAASAPRRAHLQPLRQPATDASRQPASQGSPGTTAARKLKKDSAAIQAAAAGEPTIATCPAVDRVPQAPDARG